MKVYFCFFIFVNKHFVNKGAYISKSKRCYNAKPSDEDKDTIKFLYLHNCTFEIFAKFTGKHLKHLCRSRFLIMLQTSEAITGGVL